MISWKAFSKGIVLAALGMTLSANAESKRYMVQFKSPETFKAMTQNVAKHNMFSPMRTSGLKLFNSNASVTQALEHVQLLVIESEDASAIASLRQHPSIAFVEEEMMHPAPAPIATLGTAMPMAKRTAAMDMPWGITAVRAPQAWLSTRGTDMKVMVLDTGLDVEHIAVKSRFIGGRNFTGGSSTDVTDTAGHGTHVAGTILADGVDNGLTGVAPDAKLLMGKVCSENGCSSIAIANGLDWAIAEGAHVVNMSLGGFFISEAEVQALIRAEAAGVMVIAASGNGGNGRVSYPAAYETVLAVGAVDEALLKADFSQWGPELAVMGPGVDVISSVPRGTGRGAVVMMEVDGKGNNVVNSTPFVGSPITAMVTNEVVFAGLGKPEDFTNINVSGKFALISRGELTFKDKVANAIAAGATGVVVFNNAPGMMQGSLTDDGTEAAIPAVMIEQTVGEEAKLALSNGEVVRFSMAVEATDFASFQGTSMATPHVAGVAALVRAANPMLTPAQVRDVLKNTCTELGPNPNNEYGRGIVNAEAAVALAQTMGTGAMLKVAN